MRDRRSQSRAATTTPAAEAARRVLAIAPAMFAALLGAFLVFGVGFASPQALHNATHDVRHGAGFPCH